MGFYEQVYQLVEQIPQGKVATYGQIAMMLGNPRASRAVGYALHCNPRPGEVPCHRVVNRFGQLCRGFAFGGMEIQKALLVEEGVEVDEEGTVDLARFCWDGVRVD